MQRYPSAILLRIVRFQKYTFLTFSRVLKVQARRNANVTRLLHGLQEAI